jgi:hypothetical protein
VDLTRYITVIGIRRIIHENNQLILSINISIRRDICPESSIAPSVTSNLLALRDVNLSTDMRCGEDEH